MSNHAKRPRDYGGATSRYVITITCVSDGSSITFDAWREGYTYGVDITDEQQAQLGGDHEVLCEAFDSLKSAFEDDR